VQFISQHRRLFQALFAFIVLVGVIYGQYVIIGSGQLTSAISQIGYVGLFLFSFINGFNVIVPIVPTSFMPTLLDAGYQFWPLISVISVGMSFADIAGFLVGRYLGKFRQADEWGILKFLQSIQKKSYYTPLVFAFFFGAFMPLPFELVMIPLGMMRYRVETIFVISFSANVIFNLITAVGFVQLFIFLLG
jgi:membrane protein YqaA with SNARE-associated domain